MSVLVTVSPRIYREALELSLRNSRPDLEVRAAAPEDAELEIAGIRPHLFVYNDTEELGPEHTTTVLCQVEMGYPDGMDARARTGQTVFRVRDISTEDLLRAVDVTATVGILHWSWLLAAALWAPTATSQPATPLHPPTLIHRCARKGSPRKLRDER